MGPAWWWDPAWGGHDGGGCGCGRVGSCGVVLKEGSRRWWWWWVSLEVMLECAQNRREE